MRISGFVDSSSSSGEETFPVACGPGPDGPQLPASGVDLGEVVSRVGGMRHNLPCPPQRPGGIQDLEVKAGCG